jgi:hypothetical protein
VTVDTILEKVTIVPSKAVTELNDVSPPLRVVKQNKPETADRGTNTRIETRNIVETQFPFKELNIT